MRDDYADRARRVFPNGTVNDFELPDAHALVVERGEGPYVWDTTGRRYVDFLLGSGPLVLGHAYPDIVRAVAHQARMGSTYYLPSIPAVQFAELICSYVPCAEAVRYCSDGSEAVFYALRLARAATGRECVVKFEGGFHGHSDYALQSFMPSGPAVYPTAEPDSPGIPAAIGQTVYVAPFNDLEAVEAVLEREGRHIAAVVVEPIQRAIMPENGFLQGLRRLCDRSGVLLIFDEIVSGFRLCMGGAQEAYDVTPDLCALGKAMSGGTPLACVAGRRDLLEWAGRPHRSDGIYMSGTLNGNPLGCAAGMAAVTAMGERGGCDVIAERGRRLRQGLERCIGELDLKASVIGPDCFMEIVFGRGEVRNFRDYVMGDRPAVERFGLAMLERGFLVRPGAKIYLSAVHSDADVDSFVDAAGEVLHDMAAVGAAVAGPE